MTRDVGGAVLILLGIMVTRIVVSGQYLFYVAEGMARWLLLSSGILVLLGAAVLWDSWRSGRHAAAGRAGEAAGDTGGVEDHTGHGGPRIAYLLLLPVAAVYLIAPAALGSYSAARQQAAALPPSADLGVEPLSPGDPAEITVRDYVTRAVWDAGRTLEGRTVAMSGFVTPDPAGGWWLSRMGMNCCAADSQAYRVKVDPAPDLPADTWVRAVGTWLPGGTPDRPVPNLALADVEQIPAPRNPYQ